MRSSNSKFDTVGWSAVIRDLEELNLNLSDLGADAEGQSQNLGVLQNSISQTNTNVTSLANRLTADEAAISGLQTQVSGISTYRQSSDYALYSGTINFSVSGTTADQTAIGSTLVSGSLGGYNTSTGVFTVPSTGIYMVQVSVSTGGTATSGAYGRMCVSGAWTNAYLPIVQISTVPTTGVFVSPTLTAGTTFSVTLSGVFTVSQTDTFYITITRL